MTDIRGQHDAAASVEPLTDFEGALKHLSELSPMLTEDEITRHAVVIYDKLMTLSVEQQRRIGVVELDMDGDVLPGTTPFEISLPQAGI